MGGTGTGIDWAAAHRRAATAAETLARSYADDPVRREAVLRERTAALASRRRHQRRETPSQALAFRIGAERHALPLVALAAVVRGRVPGAVPGGPAALLGMVQERGAIWAVFDLRPLLGLAPCGAGAPPGTFLLMRDPQRRVAFRVDATEGVVDLAGDGERRGTGPGTGSGAAGGRPVAQIMPDGLALLDAGALLGHGLLSQTPPGGE